MAKARRLMSLWAACLDKKVAKADGNRGTARKEALAGVGVADLDQNTRAELNIPAKVQGAVITEVAPDSAAYEAGLRTGRRDNRA